MKLERIGGYSLICSETGDQWDYCLYDDIVFVWRKGTPIELTAPVGGKEVTDVAEGIVQAFYSEQKRDTGKKTLSTVQGEKEEEESEGLKALRNLEKRYKKPGTSQAQIDRVRRQKQGRW